MQSIPQELIEILAQRLKVGSRAKPVCRVEVDRLAFVPGDVQHLKFKESNYSSLTNKIIQSPSAESPISPTNFVYPVQGKTISVTSPYGTRYISAENRWDFHTGIDLAAGHGDPIVAALPGRVVLASDSGNYGSHIKIDHGDGITTLYAHLIGGFGGQGKQVNVGDWVTAGQVIAYSDSTGRSYGSHLHFEVRVNGNHTDPYPYLVGTNTVTIGVTPSVPTEVEISKPGRTVLNERFASRTWFDSPMYGVYQPFRAVATVEKSANPIDVWQRCKLTFKQGITTASAPYTAGFNIFLSMAQDGVLDLGFTTDFQKSDGDSLTISINGTPVNQGQIEFKGMFNQSEIKGIEIPAGNVDIAINVTWSGNGDKTFAFDYIKVIEVIKEKQLVGDGRYETVNELMFGEIEQAVELPIGRFVYMDTLALDNVIQCEVDDQYDQESSEAKIVLANPDGFYNPDYSTAKFGELRKESPWSYFINGYQIGVFGDNTPIRVYMGFGNNVVRVFTGLIDKVEIIGEGEEMSISCRNMYKRILEKVLTEDKKYGELTDVLPESSGTISPGWEKFETTYYAPTGNQTKTGTWPEQGRTIAVDPTVIPLNSWVQVRYPSGPFAGQTLLLKAEDTGGAIKGKIIDTFVNDEATAIQGGRHQVEIKVLGVTSDGNRPSTDPNTGEPITNNIKMSGAAWLKSAIVHDLVAHAGLFGWRGSVDDLAYPDAIIEETVLIEQDQRTGRVIKAVQGKEGVFESVTPDVIRTPDGWLNNLTEEAGKEFPAFERKVGECINEIIADTNFRSYCDRYGTYRLEQIDYNRPVVAEITEFESITKAIDFSRGRSHIVVYDDEGRFANFLDKEILIELKGEVRSTRVLVPWAKSYETKKMVAKKMFFDMKRLCRTIQIAIPGNPSFDVLDRIRVVNLQTSTREIYTIKGIRHAFSSDGFVTFLDLMWANDRAVV